jgi:N-sulfoglucosamine sulfohydrolase
MRINYIAGSCLLLVSSVSCQKKDEAAPRPNILFVISDDQSFPHAGAYGTNWVKTPAFDRVAREGLLFNNGYTPNAKCSPSRSIVLTGLNSWQLEDAANHVPFFPAKFKTFPESLKDGGYFVGFTGKGWAPGDPGMVNGKPRELIGPAFSELKAEPPAQYISNTDYAANFEAFLEAKQGDEPFFFWYGSHEPHRRYEFMAGVNKGGKQLAEVDEVFEIWPDNDTVRHDLLDYAFEIEHFDNHLKKMIDMLEERDMLENTIIVVTSDNGMPFPRLKGQGYKYSHHMPLAIMWPKGIKNPGRIIDDFVSFSDFAPTFLESAGIDMRNSGMEPVEGISLMPLFYDETGAKGRDYVIVGKERHDLGRPDDTGYPMRGIFTHEYLYLINYHPERWPAGNPETGYMNCDGSPTKTWILNERRINGKSWYWDLNFGKRPGEELYQIIDDPECIVNLAGDPAYAELLNSLKGILTSELEAQDDPRIFGNGDIFMSYEYAQPHQRDFYNRFMNNEDGVRAGWINQTDIEKGKLD